MFTTLNHWLNQVKRHEKLQLLQKIYVWILLVLLKLISMKHILFSANATAENRVLAFEHRSKSDFLNLRRNTHNFLLIIFLSFQTINAWAGSTSTTLATSTSTAPAGSMLTFMVTITGNSPTGTITIMDGTTIIKQSSITNGSYTAGLIMYNSGVRSFTAVYSGDANNLTSTSNVVNVTVSPPVSTATLTSTKATVLAGESISLATTVTAAFFPGGTVTFKDGTTIIGTAALTATRTASLLTSLSTLGAHSLTVTYPGSTYDPPATSAPVVVNVTTAATPSFPEPAKTASRASALNTMQ